MKTAAVPSILVAAVLLGLGAIAEAQQPKKIPDRPREPTATRGKSVEPFRQGLHDLGYVEGRHLIQYRWAEGKYERFPPSSPS